MSRPFGVLKQLFSVLLNSKAYWMLLSVLGPYYMCCETIGMEVLFLCSVNSSRRCLKLQEDWLVLVLSVYIIYSNQFVFGSENTVECKTVGGEGVKGLVCLKDLLICQFCPTLWCALSLTHTHNINLVKSNYLVMKW